MNVKAEQKNDAKIQTYEYGYNNTRNHPSKQLAKAPRISWFINNFNIFKIEDGILHNEIMVEEKPVISK